MFFRLPFIYNWLRPISKSQDIRSGVFCKISAFQSPETWGASGNGNYAFSLRLFEVRVGNCLCPEHTSCTLTSVVYQSITFYLYRSQKCLTVIHRPLIGYGLLLSEPHLWALRRPPGINSYSKLKGFLSNSELKLITGNWNWFKTEGFKLRWILTAACFTVTEITHWPDWSELSDAHSWLTHARFPL